MDGDNGNVEYDLKRLIEFEDDENQDNIKRARLNENEIESTNPFALTEVAKVVEEILEQTSSELSITLDKDDDEERSSIQHDAETNLLADNEEDENDELDIFINSLSGESANNNSLQQADSLAKDDLVLSSSSSSSSSVGSEDENEESQLVKEGKTISQQAEETEMMEIEQASIDKSTTELEERDQLTLPTAAPIEEHSGLSIKLPGVIHLDSETSISSKKEAISSIGTSSVKTATNSSGSSLQSAALAFSKYDRKTIDHLDLDSDSRDDSDHPKEDDDEDFDDDEMSLLKSMAGDGDDSGGEDGVNNQDLEFKLSCGLGMFSASDKVIVTDRDPKTLSKYEQERLKEKLQEEERERMQ